MEIKSYIENNKNRFLNELFDLIKIPSISAIDKYKDSVREAAIFLKNQFENLNLDNCEICETDGYPIVYAEKIKDKKLPYCFGIWTL
jgi:acetylornithine deacetylase/succinyl-diaminopimelate desuccinylase-like protein